MFSLKVDLNRVIEEVSELALINDQLPGAMAVALSEATAIAEKMLEDNLSGRVNTEKSQVTSRVGVNSVERPSRLILTSSVWVSRRAIPLRKFPRTQTAKGVAVRATQRTQFFAGAFGPNIRRLGRGVFRRVGKSRLPIERLPGISLVGKLSKQSINAVSAPAQKVLDRKIKEHVEKMLAAATSGRRIYDRIHVNRAAVLQVGGKRASLIGNRRR